MKTVKMIGTRLFEVVLIQQDSGIYIIQYHRKSDSGFDYSEDIQDFKTASFLFDLKVQEMEGN